MQQERLAAGGASSVDFIYIHGKATQRLTKNLRGGMITAPTWLGPALVMIQQKYQRVLKPVRYLKSSKDCFARSPSERKSECLVLVSESCSAVHRSPICDIGVKSFLTV